MKDFSDLAEALQWFESLAPWKRKFLTFWYAPRWPFTVNGSDLYDVEVKG